MAELTALRVSAFQSHIVKEKPWSKQTWRDKKPSKNKNNHHMPQNIDIEIIKKSRSLLDYEFISTSS